MPYVDGFLIPLKKDKVDEYKKLARKAAKIWIEHGALEYRECVGDDLNIEGMVFNFPEAAQAKRDETVIFAWVVYKSKAHRDRVNKKIMADPRMDAIKPDMVPFDYKRMAYGGFKMLVEAMSDAE